MSLLRKAIFKELKSRTRLTLARDTIRRLINNYMERNDLNIQMHRKNDTKKHACEKHQMRILND
jgi:hypothetical protein